MRQSHKEVTSPSPRNRALHRSRPHDVHKMYVSLKQWRILHAVVDCGGFAEAAKCLHLSQSAVSYTVAKLQEHLGVPLLKMAGRKAELTSAGRALLDRSRRILKEAIELESFAKNLGQGCSDEVRLMVDFQFPPLLLMHALHQFAADQRDARVRLSVRPLPRADETLHPLGVDLAISLHVPLGLLGEPLMELEYVAVANPRHPLFQLGRALSVPDLLQHVQINIANGPSLNRLADDNDSAHMESDTQRMHRWDVSSFDTAIEAVHAGLGYAWLPTCRIQKSLDEGLLAVLPLRAGLGFKATLYLVHGRSGPACHATGRLAELLRKAVVAVDSRIEPAR